MGVLDAWAYGIPCVVTPVGGLPDIVIDGENALAFPVGDVDMLSSQLKKMISAAPQKVDTERWKTDGK